MVGQLLGSVVALYKDDEIVDSDDGVDVGSVGSPGTYVSDDESSIIDANAGGTVLVALVEG